MLDEQHRRAAVVDGADQRLLELLGLGRVQARRRLVEQQDGRRGRQGAAELDQPCRSERQPDRRQVRDPLEAEQADQAVHAPGLVGRHRPHAAHREQVGDDATARVAGAVREDEVVPHGQAGEQLGVLERAGEATHRAHPREGVGDVVAVEPHGARRRAQQTGQDAEHRALAGAVRADETDDLPRRHRERDVVQRDQAAEAHRHAAALQPRRHGATFPSTSRGAATAGCASVSLPPASPAAPGSVGT